MRNLPARAFVQWGVPAAVLAVVLEVLAASAATGAPVREPAKGFFRWPDVSATRVVFAYGDRLWLVSREGGVASPLVTGSTSPRRSKFSADGSSIAYVGDFDGLYTIPTAGGAPFRVTHHPGTTDLCDWTTSGVLLFMTDAFMHVFDGDGQARVRQLFTVAPSGGLPVKLPLAYGAHGAMSEDGRWLVFTLYAEGRTEYRAHNRGGNAPDVWLFDLRTSESRRITDGPGIDTAPLWHRGIVYYLSDAGPEGRLNVWSYVPATRDRRQLTRFDDFDVKWPSMGPGAHGRGEIVFAQGTGLFLLDLESGTTRRIPVSFPPGATEPTPQAADAARQVQKAAPSADGSKAVLEARGDLWIAAGEGPPRRLTTTSGIAERDPSISPDGRWIAYFSDANGEYQLYVAPTEGDGSGRRLSTLDAGFPSGPLWSPDSKRIVFSDSTGGLYLATLPRGDTVRFDRDPLVRPAHPSWSPDSHWIAYARGAGGSPRSTAIWLYDVRAAKAHQVTSGWHADEWPVFDRAGEYLYFVRPANANSILFDVIDVNNFIYPSADLVLAVPLRRGIGSPWLPRPDGDPIPAGPPERVGVELDRLEERAVVVASESGDYSDLAVTASDGLVYLFKPTAGPTSIRLLDFRDGRAKGTLSPKTVLGAADGLSISANGKRLLVRSGGESGFVDAAEGQSLTSKLALTGMEVRPDPRAEWRQVFTDAWRMFRDFFYDASMRGVDWNATRKKYAPLLDACASRSDVDLVIGDMGGELGSSHVFVASGPETPEESTGMLGVDFTLHRGAFRIAKIHDGGIADALARNPLRRAGLTVDEGEYLLAVNGTPLDTTLDPWAAFKGLAGKRVTLTVGPNPSIDASARTVVLNARSREDVLRNRAWVEANRLEVDRATGGRVGYIYLANTHDYGSTEFTRQLAGQLDREGVIIDERWNEGGYVPFHFVDVLARKRYLYFGERRRGIGGRTPDYFIDGPACMLINEIAYSGGDQLPYYFRARGLGPLIGRRTLGGMVGGMNPPLIDGGFVLIPFVAFYASSNAWAVEGTGVEPDIDVIDDPAALARGEDPQLEAAIRYIEGELGKRTRPVVPRIPGAAP